MPALIETLRTRPWAVALLIGLAAQALFTWHIDWPGQIMFDETHYVPAAQALINMAAPRNTEHPLVGKELIALGIRLFGDDVYGWRLMPSFAGTATVIGGFAFLWLLLGRMKPAVVGAVLMLLNQMLFIQARIAMLDVFLGAFVTWSLVTALWAMRGSPGQVTWRWLLSAVLMGLAVGVKWAAIPYEALLLLGFLAVRLRSFRPAGTRWAYGYGWAIRAMVKAKASDQPVWPGMGTIRAVLSFGVLSIAVYLLTFWPMFFYKYDAMTLGHLIPFQREMYDLQTQKLPGHTYQASWWSWPLMLRPIWYFYQYDLGAQRGVLMIGNPVILWGGLVAVYFCLFAAGYNRAIRPLAVGLLWIASIGMYAIIPKSLGFFYYYYLSANFLCWAIAVAFDHFDAGKKRGYEDWFVAVAFLVFVYFYPIISAAPLPDDQGFTRWMLFESWR